VIKKSVLRGLCRNCVSGGNCTFLNGQHRRVVQCAEFVALTKAEVERRWVNPVDDEESGAVSLNGRRGLCRSCGRWQECAFPHAEGGVWHCEEYS
jgi:hypothetical protein